MDFSSLVKRIQQKKELRGINSSLILEKVQDYIRKRKINLDSLKESQVKQLVKDIRAALRISSGRFRYSFSHSLNLLEKNEIEKLLSRHSSTKERLSGYFILKKEIDKLNPKSILDLGCGINPIAIAKPGILYFASDINEEDLKLVSLFFEKNGIKGNVFFHDLRKSSDSLPNADVCLLLKVFDVLETKGHKLAEVLLKSIPCPVVIVSFSTKTLSGKPMNHPQRGWIERLSTRLNYSFSTFKISNEIFYIIRKLV